MNTMLAGMLAVVVAAGMQWNMGIGNIMAQIGGDFQYLNGVFFPKCHCKPRKHTLDPPWHDAMPHQTVFRKPFDRRIPLPGKRIKGVPAIPVHVNEMTGSLPCNGISALVRVNGVIGQELDILLVKTDQFRRKKKNGTVIYLTMGKETPTEAGGGEGKNHPKGEPVLFHHSHSFSRIHFILTVLTWSGWLLFPLISNMLILDDRHTT
jgi:hypothetical protein